MQSENKTKSIVQVKYKQIPSITQNRSIDIPSTSYFYFRIILKQETIRYIFVVGV